MPRLHSHCRPWRLLNTPTAVLTVTLAATMVVACATEDRPAEELPIGWLGALSSAPDQSPADRDSRNAVQLRFEETAAEGGLVLGGRRLVPRLATEDTGATPQDSVDAARRLIYQEHVVALIGPNRSRDAIAVAGLAEHARVPMISPISTHPETTAGRRWVFRVASTDPSQAEALARFARRDLHATTGAVLLDIADEYSRGLADRFQSRFKHLGGEVVAAESYTSTETSWDGQLQRIAAARPTVLLLPSYAAVARAQIAAARALGIGATMLGGDTWIPQYIEHDPLFENAYSCHHWHVSLAKPGSAARRFHDRYVARFGHEPETGAFLTWDAAGLLLDALRRAGGADPGALRDALATTESYPGLTGTLSYRHRGGDPAKPIYLLHFTDGQTVVHRTLGTQLAEKAP